MKTIGSRTPEIGIYIGGLSRVQGQLMTGARTPYKGGTTRGTITESLGVETRLPPVLDPLRSGAPVLPNPNAMAQHKEGVIMKARFIAIVTAALLGVSATAHAGSLSSGALYGGGTQNTALCYVRNVGLATVPAPVVKLFDENGVALTLNHNSCTGTLAPNAACNAYSFIVNNLAHSCTVTTGSTKNFRGTFDIRSGGAVLQTDVLR